MNVLSRIFSRVRLLWLKNHFPVPLLLFFVILQTSCGNSRVTIPTSTHLTSFTPTTTLTATATPQPREPWGEPSYSPNGKWVASRYKFYEGEISFLSFFVKSIDGSSVWEIETIPIENKPPYLEFPAPFLWSKDNKTFYFVDQGFQDGCFTYAGGGKKLYGLNLDSGKTTTVLDKFASEIKFSPDESKIAYVNYGKTGLQILDVETGKEIEFEHLYPDLLTDQYSLVWTPDSNQLAFTIILDACISDKATTIVIVDVSKNSQKIIIKEDVNHLYTKEWVDENRILVSDWSNDPAHLWYLDTKTGELTLVNQ